MDFEIARENMIEQQIRPWEVLDQRVLDRFKAVPREGFIPEEYKQLALADVRIPLANNQQTMTPKLEARLLQALDLQPRDRVLEIGTGCGFMAAVLAGTAGEVHSVDIFHDFITAAEKKLFDHGIENVALYTGDGIAGWPEQGPYDAIIVTGSVPAIPDQFREQLSTAGRLVVIVGASPVMHATLVTRVGPDQWASEVLFETDLPPLLGAETTPKFQF